MGRGCLPSACSTSTGWSSVHYHERSGAEPGTSSDRGRDGDGRRLCSALRYALNDPAIGLVTAIGRRSLGIPHPKLKEVLNQDFADCSALTNALTGQDAAVFCLGAYTGAVSD